jgi:hypothetical protein
MSWSPAWAVCVCPVCICHISSLSTHPLKDFIFWYCDYGSTGVSVTQESPFLWICTHGGIAASDGGSISSFMRGLCTVFHRGYISLHSHKQWLRTPLSPHIPQHKHECYCLEVLGLKSGPCCYAVLYHFDNTAACFALVIFQMRSSVFCPG